MQLDDRYTVNQAVLSIVEAAMPRAEGPLEHIALGLMLQGVSIMVCMNELEDRTIDKENYYARLETINDETLVALSRLAIYRRKNGP